MIAGFVGQTALKVDKIVEESLVAFCLLTRMP
jgi:hypothetical protein